MKYLELKIPPVLLVFLFSVFMWVVSLALPQIDLHRYFKNIVFGLLSAISALIVILGVVSFRRADTTVNPINPGSSSSLVQTGIYKYTRNPMYLGFVLFLVGLSVFLQSIFSMFLIPLFIVYMNVFQIKPEEEALVKLFGEEFTSYQKNVRRWI
ncbi:isoprenylcysteine carboxylmethyltransferase family protein [Microbulbifer sp. TYP-18]|uniref:isoprenylcysteine carboxylmethyltransferase family protein n=1 Tax=Microbulbifer sp. TYP-18 TaxID=3230024 RepID=UPI0034C600C5